MKYTQSRPTPYNSHVKTTTSIPIISRRVVPLHWIHNTSQSPAHHVTYSRLRDDHLSNLVVKLLGHLFKRTATPTENVKMANVRKTKQMSKNQRGVLGFFFFKATSDSRAFIFGNAFPVLLFLLPSPLVSRNVGAMVGLGRAAALCRIDLTSTENGPFFFFSIFFWVARVPSTSTTICSQVPDIDDRDFFWPLLHGKTLLPPRGNAARFNEPVHTRKHALNDR